jgi:leucyl aminopeptidase
MISAKLIEKLDTANKRVVVVGLALSSGNKGDLRIHAQSGVISPAISKALIASLVTMGAKGALDEVVKVPLEGTLWVFSGLGTERTSAPKWSHELLRRASGAAIRNLLNVESVTIALPVETTAAIGAVSEGALMGSYSYTDYRFATKAHHATALTSVNILVNSAKESGAKAAVARAAILAEEISFVRDLINMPPNDLTPDSFSQMQKKRALSAGLKVEIVNDATLRTKGFGGITAVGQASAAAPRLLHISYKPAKAKKTFAFIGKGITFDSGGLNLKPGASMWTMKSDMSGAAAVVGAIIAIAKLKLPVAVDVWAALAENMISENATRPSDIITMYGGKTVEVLNPDAEGRLVMADALVRAEEYAKKTGGLDGIIDVATLTGAQVVALGTHYSAVMTNNEKFSEDFLAAAQSAGENFWPMPLPEELRASLDSPVADLANIGDRYGGMLVAGLFLREFVNPATPWLHLDIAGPSFNEHEAHGYTPTGGTGVAVRSLVRLMESAASQA